MGATILESHLSQVASERRICELTDADGFFSDLVGTKNILRWSTKQGLRLRVRNRSWKNPLSPRCFVKFLPAADGTKIEVRTTTALYPVVFMFVWLGGVVVIGTPMLILSAFALAGARMPFPFTGSPIFGVLVPLTLLAFGIVNVQLGRRRARIEEAEILSFLARELSKDKCH